MISSLGHHDNRLVWLLHWHHHWALRLHHGLLHHWLLLHHLRLLLDHHWALLLHHNLVLVVHQLLLLIDHRLLLRQLALHRDHLRLVVVLHDLLGVLLLRVWIHTICKHQALHAWRRSSFTILEKHGCVISSSCNHEVSIVLRGLCQVFFDSIFGDFFLCIDNFADVRAPHSKAE